MSINNVHHLNLLTISLNKLRIQFISAQDESYETIATSVKERSKTTQINPKFTKSEAKEA